MTIHKFYRVRATTYSNCTGAKYPIDQVEYCTNDNGEGIFTGSCIAQITGNCQFSGGREAVKKFMDDIDARLFDTERGAKIYANRMTKKNPLKKIEIRTYNPGEKVRFLCSDCTVIGQVGEDVTISYNDQPDHTTDVKFYEIY